MTLFFVFRLPGSVAYVPALTEESARSALARNCYKGAPVKDWPCIRAILTSRRHLDEMLTTLKLS